MSQLQDSHKYCAGICAKSGSSFTSAFRQLAPCEKQAMEAVYAFMRTADDLVDSSSQPAEQRAVRLASFQAHFLSSDTDDVHELPQTEHSLLFPAVWEVIHRFSIPTTYFLEVLQGIRMDLEQNFYNTPAELEEYCYHVASAVGLICLHIWGVSPEEIKPKSDTEVFQAAVACGKALQWTNILRDVLEDARNSRLYLPLQDWVAAASNTFPDLVKYSPSEQSQWVRSRILSEDVSFFLPVIQQNLVTAERFYRQARLLYTRIPARNRRVFSLITGVYFQIWKKIQRQPLTVFHKKVKLTSLEKLKVCFCSFFP